jgi:very-short-patch-repair endonuclease
MSQFGVRSIVEELRRRLIDIGRGNDLINFEPKPASKKRIRLIDSSISIVHARLSAGVTEIAAETSLTTTYATSTTNVPMLPGIIDASGTKGAARPFRRTTRPIVSALPKDDPRYDLVGTKGSDKVLQSDLPQVELDSRLLTIKRDHETSLQETGVGLACVVLGILEWSEDPRSKLINHSPLLVMPITMDRQVVRNRHVHTIGSDEGEMHTNAALREALRTDHGIELPDLEEDEAPDAYLDRIEPLFVSRPDFTVRRHATVALMKSMQMVVWRDLDLSRWNEGMSTEHRLLPTLLGVESTSDRTGQFETDHDVAALMDVSYGSVPPIIYDADTSQHSAVIDMVNGDDVAIEGPPGSGKSQTIANMIAAAINQGKKVLFVAEKKTALDVVAGRLRERGFGDLLFELYSATASKAEVAKSLRRRIHATATPNDPSLMKARSQIRARTVELRSHLHATTSPLAHGRDLYEEIWTSVSLESTLPDHLVRVSRTMPRHGCPLDVAEATAMIEERLASEYDARRHGQDDDPWRIFPLDPNLDIRQVEAFASDASDGFGRLVGRLHDEVASDWSPTLMQMDALVGMSAELLSITSGPDLLRVAIQDERRLRHPIDLAETLERMDRECRRIDPTLPDMDPALVAEMVRASAKLDVLSKGDAFASIGTAQSTVDRCTATMMRIDTLCGPAAKQDSARCVSMAKAILRILELDRTTITVGTSSQDPRWKEHVQGLEDQHAILEREAATLIRHFHENRVDEVPLGDLEADVAIVSGVGLLGRMGSKYKNARERLTSLLVRDDVEDEIVVRRIREFIDFSAKWASFMNEPSSRRLMPKELWTNDEPRFSEALTMAESYRTAASTALALGIDATRYSHLDETAARNVRMDAEDIVSTCSTILEPESPQTMLLHAQERLEGLRGLERLCNETEVASTSRIDLTMMDSLLRLKASKQEFAVASESALGSTEDMRTALRDAEMLDRNSVPQPVLEALASSPRPGETMRSILSTLSTRAGDARKAIRPLENIVRMTGVSLSDLCDTDPRHVSDWKSLSTRLACFEGNSAPYEARLRLERARHQIRENGLDDVVSHMLETSVPTEAAAALYTHAKSRIAAHEGMIKHAGFATRPRPHARTLDQARADIRDLDSRIQTLDANQIVATCMSDTIRIDGVGKGPVGEWTQRALVDREIEKLKRHVPIRSLVARAAADLRQLKPIWLMSPSTVAQFLPRDPDMFDLLVIDEASQMLPEYALGAIMRTRQAVVVGDRHQMPPNLGFTRSADGADQQSAEAIEDVESILDMANRSFLRRRRLKWHYRSQHPSLIAFSNRQFYDDELVVSPSASPTAIDLGVHCHRVAEPSYRSGENIGEAEELVASLASLVRSHPQHSYMIVAMNGTQAEIISEMVEQLEIDDPEYRAHKAAHDSETEKTIVVSLENCQGHERDIVLVSVVYGQKNAQDRHVSQAFSGINGSSGHRRLNVMITRAKRAVHLFTSMDASQMSTQSTNRGVQDLRDYIQYASDGVTVHDAQGREEPDSDFERVVGDALRSAGFGVTFQVGVRGFRIDIGVSSSPGHPGFIAGIECDGAHWHRGLSVRERDRIRQGVLEGLGWTIYRIWSTDWYHDPKAETARLVEWLRSIEPVRSSDANEHDSEDQGFGKGSIVSAVSCDGPMR